MRKFIVSNRVFWAGVVLASAALIGRNAGQAQPPKSPPIISEIRTRQLVLMDKAGKVAAILTTSDEGNAVLSLLSKTKEGATNGSIDLMTAPDGDNALVFFKKGKIMRSIAPDQKMDTIGGDTGK